MKIVMLCDYFFDDSQYQENLLAKYYTKHGHEVVIITSSFKTVFDYYANKFDGRNTKEVYNSKGVKIYRLPFSINILNKLRRFKGVSEVLHVERPEFIYMYNIHLNLNDAVKYIKKNIGCKMIMDYHCDYCNSANNWLSLNILHKVIRKFVLYRGIDYIDKIFPIVPTSRIFLNEVYGIPLDRMEILPLGADTDFTKLVIQSNLGAKVRQSLNIPENDLVVFTGGKLTPNKKTEILIDSFNMIANPDLHLIIVGEAGSTDTVYKKTLIEKSKNNNRIHFIGWVDGESVYKYMNACDFAVFPASQSILWQQAISMGLPLIVGKLYGNDPSYLNLYDNIKIIDAEDLTSETIAKEIIYLINNKNLLRQLQFASLKVADELFNFDKIVQKTLSVY